MNRFLLGLRVAHVWFSPFEPGPVFAVFFSNIPTLVAMLLELCELRSQSCSLEPCGWPVLSTPFWVKFVGVQSYRFFNFHLHPTILSPKDSGGPDPWGLDQ